MTAFEVGGVCLALDLFFIEPVDSREIDLETGEGDRVIRERDLDLERDLERDFWRLAESAFRVVGGEGDGERDIGE